MRMKFFTVPVHGGEAAAEALDRFLIGHRIVAVDKQFVQDGQSSAWALSRPCRRRGETTWPPMCW